MSYVFLMSSFLTLQNAAASATEPKTTPTPSALKARLLAAYHFSPDWIQQSTVHFTGDTTLEVQRAGFVHDDTEPYDPVNGKTLCYTSKEAYAFSQETSTCTQANKEERSVDFTTYSNAIQDIQNKNNQPIHNLNALQARFRSLALPKHYGCGSATHEGNKFAIVEATGSIKIYALEE